MSEQASPVSGTAATTDLVGTLTAQLRDSTARIKSLSDTVSNQVTLTQSLEKKCEQLEGELKQARAGGAAAPAGDSSGGLKEAQDALAVAKRDKAELERNGEMHIAMVGRIEIERAKLEAQVADLHKQLTAAKAAAAAAALASPPTSPTAAASSSSSASPTSPTSPTAAATLVEGLSAEEAVRKLSEEREVLRKERDDAKKNLVVLFRQGEADKTASKTTIEALTAQITELKRAPAPAAPSAGGSNDDEMRRLQSKMEEIKREYDAETTVNRAHISRLQAERQKVTTEKDEALEQLRKEHEEALKAKHDEHAATHSAVSAELEQLRSEKASIEREKHELSTELGTLKVEQEKQKEIQAKLHLLEEQHKEHSAAADGLRAEAKTKADEIEKLGTHITQLSASISTHQAHVHELRAAKDDHGKTIQVLQGKVSEKEQAHASLETQVRELTLQNEEIKAAFDEFKKSAQQAQAAQQKEAEDQKHMTVQLIAQMRKEADDQVKDKDLHVDKLRGELDVRAREKHTLIEDIANQKHRYDKERAEQASLLQVLKQLKEDEVARLTSNCELLKMERDEKDAERQRAGFMMQGLTGEYDKLRKKLEDTETELAAQRAKLQAEKDDRKKFMDEEAKKAARTPDQMGAALRSLQNKYQEQRDIVDMMQMEKVGLAQSVRDEQDRADAATKALEHVKTELTTTDANYKKATEIIRRLRETEMQLRSQVIKADNIIKENLEEKRRRASLPTPEGGSKRDADEDRRVSISSGPLDPAISNKVHQNIRYEGWVFKRPFGFSLSSGWKRRWFVLVDKVIYYYSVEGKQRVIRGQINLTGDVTVKTQFYEESPFGFEIAFPSQKKVHQMFCENGVERDHWKVAILDALADKPFTAIDSKGNMVGPAPRVQLFGGSLRDSHKLQQQGSVPPATATVAADGTPVVADAAAAVVVAPKKLWVPVIMWECVEFLKKEGMAVVGLFRVPGSNDNIQVLRTAYEKGEAVALKDANDVAGVMKLYLRMLSDSLIPSNFYQGFVGSSEEKTKEERIARLRLNVYALPRENKALLAYLTHFLTLVAAQSDTNKMDSKNCAMVFAPNMLRKPVNTLTPPPLNTASPARSASNAGEIAARSMMETLSNEIACVQYLIDNFGAVFSDVALQPTNEAPPPPAGAPADVAEESEPPSPAPSTPTPSQPNTPLTPATPATATAGSSDPARALSPVKAPPTLSPAPIAKPATAAAPVPASATVTAAAPADRAITPARVLSPRRGV